MSQPATTPATDYGVAAAVVGIIGWLLAGLLAVLNRAWLAAHDASWLVAAAFAGVVIGIVELGIFTRRRQAYQAHQ